MTLQDLRGNLKESDNCLDIYKDNSDLEELEIKPDQGLNAEIKPRSVDKAKGEDLFNDVCGMYDEIEALMQELLKIYCSVLECDDDHVKNQEIQSKIYDSEEYKEFTNNLMELKNKRKGDYYNKNKNYLTASCTVFLEKDGDYMKDYNAYRYGILLGTVHKYIAMIKESNTSGFTPFLLVEMAKL